MSRVLITPKISPYPQMFSQKSEVKKNFRSPTPKAIRGGGAVRASPIRMRDGPQCSSCERLVARWHARTRLRISFFHIVLRTICTVNIFLLCIESSVKTLSSHQRHIKNSFNGTPACSSVSACRPAAGFISTSQCQQYKSLKLAGNKAKV